MSEQSPIKFFSQGAILNEFNVAGHNIVLSFPSPEAYIDAQYFGETIGRVANRIPNGQIHNLNGREYQLCVNKGTNHLHGGKEGWGKKTFRGPTPVSHNGKNAVRYTYLSPDGEEGYPGAVELQVFYTVYEKNEQGVAKTTLEVEYHVELMSQECDETAVNVTNHSYFNLSGSDTIEGTQAVLSTVDYLPVDHNGIPLGSVESYPGLEAGRPFVLHANEGKIDHCFVLERDISNIPLDTRARQAQLLASFSHPDTKIHLEVYSTEPAFQFYTGQHIKVAASEYGPEMKSGAGFCVEPGRYTNAINVPEWRSMMALRQGQVWGAKNIYKAWKA
ncbi:uncharacterized protein Z520_00835 [Fonsecaea multimorphosa CBS 102226]|uniref:Aldose 1-epimerase n=1 Tax=Fonsecaea multimorphosa CBS 102226 TaxID=1442371 RepID=A0A0D2KDE8_9EURO|nr:uncharacterized protein Z520_00835 [Fonsecaea multimorphosa CBS 102226]KIY04143.1 hypothetical protein Z520_00835 [Fonsecaea multimorphosa CBS 102226]OAL31973.1 hypothetical protein AYO22_00843 [Fonsecaea multimorphosa]